MPTFSWRYPFSVAPGRWSFPITHWRRSVSVILLECLISIVWMILPLMSPYGTIASPIIALIFLTPCDLRPFGHHSFQPPSFCHISYSFFYDCAILSPVFLYLVESAVKPFGMVLALVLPILLISANTQSVMYYSGVMVWLPLRSLPLLAWFGPSIHRASLFFIFLPFLTGTYQNPKYILRINILICLIH